MTIVQFPPTGVPDHAVVRTFQSVEVLPIQGQPRAAVLRMVVGDAPIEFVADLNQLAELGRHLLARAKVLDAQAARIGEHY